MSTLNLNIDECSESQFPIELVFTGNKIYNSIVSLAKSTAGFLVLIPIFIASIIVLPFTYLFSCIILTYLLVSIRRKVNKLIKVEVSDDNYKEHYHLFLNTKECLSEFEKIIHKSGLGTKGKLLIPILYYLKNFSLEIKKLNNHLKDQLFEAFDASTIPVEDVKFLKDQLDTIEHDWDDDKLWADFQVEHHQHMSN